MNANLYSISQDKRLYNDPSFIPERFLGEQGRYTKPVGKHMLPFGIGSRACPGESLARAELLMILVTFVQRFEASRVSEEKVREDGIDVFTVAPRPFEYILKPRQ